MVFNSSGVFTLEVKTRIGEPNPNEMQKIIEIKVENWNFIEHEIISVIPMCTISS